MVARRNDVIERKRKSGKRGKRESEGEKEGYVGKKVGEGDSLAQVTSPSGACSRGRDPDIVEGVHDGGYFLAVICL